MRFFDFPERDPNPPQLTSHFKLEIYLPSTFYGSMDNTKDTLIQQHLMPSLFIPAMVENKKYITTATKMQ